MKNYSPMRWDRVKLALSILRFILMFFLGYYSLGFGSMIVGKMTLRIPLSIFSLSHEVEGIGGALILGLGMFIGECGWVITSLFSGLIIGAILMNNGAKWGIGVALSMNAFRLQIIWTLMRRGEYLSQDLLLINLVIFFLISLLSCFSGALGGYSGEKAVITVLSKCFHRYPLDRDQSG